MTTIPFSPWIGKNIDSIFIERSLGTLGDVYWFEGRDTRTGAWFWLLTPQEQQVDETTKTAWFDEVRVLQGFSHASCLTPIRFLVEPESLQPFVVYEALAGVVSLQSLFGLLSQAEVVSIFSELSDAIEALHHFYQKQGNRGNRPQLQPDRILVARSGELLSVRWLLIPGGRQSSTTKTQAGVIRGALRYLSPEEVRGESASQSSDFFVLGSILLEAISGHPTFRAESDLQTLNRIMSGQSQSLQDKSVPQTIRSLSQELLQTDPKQRLSDAASFQQKLRQTLGHEGAAKSSVGFLSEQAEEPSAVLGAVYGSGFVDDEAPVAAGPPLEERVAVRREIVISASETTIVADRSVSTTTKPAPEPMKPEYREKAGEKTAPVSTEAAPAPAPAMDFMEQEVPLPPPASKGAGLGSLIGGLIDGVGGLFGKASEGTDRDAKPTPARKADQPQGRARGAGGEMGDGGLPTPEDKPVGEAPKQRLAAKKKAKAEQAPEQEEAESKKEGAAEDKRASRSRRSMDTEKEREISRKQAEIIPEEARNEPEGGGGAAPAAPKPKAAAKPVTTPVVSVPVQTTSAPPAPGAPPPPPAPSASSAPLAPFGPGASASRPMGHPQPAPAPAPPSRQAAASVASPPMPHPVAGKPAAVPNMSPPTSTPAPVLETPEPAKAVVDRDEAVAGFLPQEEAEGGEELSVEEDAFADELDWERSDSSWKSDVIGEKTARILRRKGVVRSYTQMNPGKIFPLLVSIVEAEMYIKIPDLPQVQQIESDKVLQIKESSPYVRIVPVLPGCIISPPEAVVDVREKKVDIEFWIAPQSEGDLTRSARVQIWHDGLLKDEIPVPCVVVTQTLTKIASYFSVFSSLFGAIFETYGKKWTTDPKVLTTESTSMASYVLQKTVALLSSSGIWLGLFFLLTAFLCYLWLKPKEGDVIERFLSTEIH